jgi:hypothetical protein
LINSNLIFLDVSKSPKQLLVGFNRARSNFS